jgi:hypothetical protein
MKWSDKHNIYDKDNGLKQVNTTSSNVQIKPSTEYFYSTPSQFEKGTINPIEKRITTNHLNIDTRFRQNYNITTSSDFYYVLPLKMKNVVSMKIVNIELPIIESFRSFYTISSKQGNNSFVIMIDMTGENARIVIPDGNYEGEVLLDYINNRLTSLGGKFALICFVFNPETGQVVMGIKTGAPFIFSFTAFFETDMTNVDDKINPLPLKFGWMLGFRKGVYSGKSIYVSEGCLDLSGARYLYLVVEDYHNSSNDMFYGLFGSSLLPKNVLGRIQMRYKDDKAYVFNNDNSRVLSNTRTYFGPVNIENIKIQLVDDFGRVVDLNNMDYSFALEMDVLVNL